jgi:hypothetical protein
MGFHGLLRSVLRFLLREGLNANDIHKEMFLVHCGKCLSRKAFYNWVEKVSQERSKVADNVRYGEEVAETSQKTFMLQVSTHW